jgi:hypothetical protein
MGNYSFVVPSLNAFQQSLTITTTNLLTSMLSFFPRILAALLIFIFGIALARWVKRIVTRSLETVRLSQGLEKTPIQAFLKNAEVTTKIEVILANIVYWLLLLVVLHTSVSILGLTAVSAILNRILFYIPNIFSAVLVLFFGTLLAGLAETVVKGAIKSVDARSSRLLGTVASYLIMVIAVLAAVNELGIAQQFITTLFTGFVASITIAVGLAFGLGSKDTVAKAMDEWYKELKKK